MLGVLAYIFSAAFQDVAGRKLDLVLQACNVYGGKESCMTLPSDSEFARLCPNHDLKVSLDIPGVDNPERSSFCPHDS